MLRFTEIKTGIGRQEMQEPSKHDIDAVAYFIEAVRELKDSPFFSEEYGRLRISIRTGKRKNKLTGLFPDQHIQRSMILPFRLVWQQNEICHYLRVVNILKRYIPEFRNILDRVVFNVEKKNVMQIQMPELNHEPLPLKDIIDIWFNTRYLHVGSSAQCGRFNREYFDRLNKQFGPLSFECDFLVAVKEVGVLFFNILSFAEIFMQICFEHGWKPSFVFDFADQPKNENIERWSPGFTLKGKTTPSKKVWRLRRRQDYRALSSFLDLTRITNTKIAKIVHECASFNEFIDRCDIVVKKTNRIKSGNNSYTSSYACMDNHSTAIKNRRCRTGFVAKQKDGTIVCSTTCIPVLREQYIEFRNAFSRRPFK